MLLSGSYEVQYDVTTDLLLVDFLFLEQVGCVPIFGVLLPFFPSTQSEWLISSSESQVFMLHCYTRLRRCFQ